MVNDVAQDLRRLSDGYFVRVDLTADRRSKEPFTDDTAAAIVRRMRANGVLASPIGTAIEMAPPLITEREQLAQAVAATVEAVRDVAKERGLG